MCLFSQIVLRPFRVSWLPLRVPFFQVRFVLVNRVFVFLMQLFTSVDLSVKAVSSKALHCFLPVTPFYGLLGYMFWGLLIMSGLQHLLSHQISIFFPQMFKKIRYPSITEFFIFMVISVEWSSSFSFLCCQWSGNTRDSYDIHCKLPDI